ncbi:MAG: beta-1,6-N-acetylglucosaminyltransferase, partial [Chlorobiales bacterium]|nr:beta-1,6-N-acetylglucosaminyltransferase [Chlorobiales bacterium]
MKVAFLITAYNQPRHLHRLIKAMNHPDFYFFIHIDLNADISPFKCLDFGKNTFFLDGEDRILVYHGGYTQVESVINLMRVATRTNDFDYFFFLSGSDYPIKPANYIHAFLKSHYPTNFIDFYPLVDNTDSIQYIRKYYFDDLTGKIPKPVGKYARIGINRICKRLPDRPFPKGITPFRGAPWFCLNK